MRWRRQVERIKERLLQQRWRREAQRSDAPPLMSWQNVTLTATDLRVMRTDGTWATGDEALAMFHADYFRLPMPVWVPTDGREA